MKRVMPMLVLVIFVSATPAAAQGKPADEKAIRDVIASVDNGMEGPSTADIVVWTGAMKAPRVKGQPDPGLRDGARVGRATRTQVRKLEVASAGDLAYEFSDAELVVKDAANAEKETRIPISVLRVWKKVDGQWVVAAHFSRSHEQ